MANEKSIRSLEVRVCSRPASDGLLRKQLACACRLATLSMERPAACSICGASAVVTMIALRLAWVASSNTSHLMASNHGRIIAYAHVHATALR